MIGKRKDDLVSFFAPHKGNPLENHTVRDFSLMAQGIPTDPKGYEPFKKALNKKDRDPLKRPFRKDRNPLKSL